MGELYEPFPKLPKNFRQIGERDQVLKLYLEDYVNTYLKRLQPAKGADLRVGLLLGSRETHEDIPFVFVDGALEMDSVTEEGGKVAFTEDAWKKAYQDVSQANGLGMFPLRGTRLYLKPPDLLEAAQPVFYRKEPAHVSELRPGGRGSCLHNILRWILQIKRIQHIL